MPQENEENVVDPSQQDGEEVAAPSEDGGAAQDASAQQADQNLGEPTEEGDGPNRWGDGPNR